MVLRAAWARSSGLRSIPAYHKNQEENSAAGSAGILPAIARASSPRPFAPRWALDHRRFAGGVRDFQVTGAGRSRQSGQDARAPRFCTLNNQVCCNNEFLTMVTGRYLFVRVQFAGPLGSVTR